MSRRPDRLGAVVRRLALRSARRGRRRDHTAAIGDRIERLEAELDEVRGRVNALFFAVLAVALGELVTRVVVG